MDKRALILQIIDEHGPVIPSEVKEHTGLDLTIIGAFLSELVASKQLYYTQAKIGGSPVYFKKGQEELLDKLRSHLNQKDRNFYDTLKEHGILKDDELSSLQKASARALTDFSIGLTIKWEDQHILYWKWHTLSNQEAADRIKHQLSPQIKKQPQEESKPKTAQTPQPSTENHNQKIDTKHTLQADPLPIQQELNKPQKTLTTPQSKTLPLPQDPLVHRLEEVCEKLHIKIIEATIIRAKKDVEATAHLHIGNTKMLLYIRYKDKKKCNDADLSQAFVQGQLRHITPAFFTTGELTKKTKELLETDFKGMLIMEGI